jgi:hypothetical protein
MTLQVDAWQHHMPLLQESQGRMAASPKRGVWSIKPAGLPTPLPSQALPRKITATSVMEQDDYLLHNISVPDPMSILDPLLTSILGDSPMHNTNPFISTVYCQYYLAEEEDAVHQKLQNWYDQNNSMLFIHFPLSSKLECCPLQIVFASTACNADHLMCTSSMQPA